MAVCNTYTMIMSLKGHRRAPWNLGKGIKEYKEKKAEPQAGGQEGMGGREGKPDVKVAH